MARRARYLPRALLGAALGCAAAPTAPVIGIYPTLAPYTSDPAVYQSYVEWAQQFGASAVLLPAEGDAGAWLGRLSALLIPGGPTYPVARFADALIKRAIEANAAGGYFPLWGTCLGHEWIVESVGGVGALQIGTFDGEDLPAALAFEPPPGARAARLYSDANRALRRSLQTESISYFSHRDGIEPERFMRNPALSSLFDIVATSKDRTGKTYVAAMEGKRWPIYGVQYHPEKIRYQNNTGRFGPLHIPKSAEAAAGADAHAEFLTSEASKSRRRPPGPEVRCGAAGGAKPCTCEDLAALGRWSEAEARGCSHGVRGRQGASTIQGVPVLV